ncbi:MAG: serine hydrolase [Planctomycetota bacterium]|nr:serine hydrolase [Planctomycetota bacterium]
MRYLILVLVLAQFVSISRADVQTIAIDFGPKRTTGDGWNNVTDPASEGLVLRDAADTRGHATSVQVKQIDPWAGFNLNGHPRDRPFPGSAKGDSFYLERGVDARAQIHFEGLTPKESYRITVFGSRLGGGEGRVGRFAIGDKSLDLDAHNNSQHVIEFEDIQPDERGVVALDVSLIDGQQFAYLGVLTITGCFGDATEFKQPRDSLDGPPIVSAKAWAIADAKTGKLLWGSHESVSRNMASTTKMMTAWIVFDLVQHDEKLLDEVVTFSQVADKTGGSTANLKTGERITIRDLLFGLLLPSGNDAAVALGEHFGHRFRDSKPNPAEQDVKPSSAKMTDEQSLAMFVQEMNRRAKKLDMEETLYLDPHGNSRNRSSARNLVRLAWTCLQNPTFCKYVGTRSHRCTVKQTDGTERAVEWKNTNRLLDMEGFDGVKTGTTGGAGACLVSSGHRDDDHLLVVVLGASSSDGRYVDSRNLYRWAWKQRGHK